MGIYKITKAVSSIGGGVFKMKTSHKVAIGVATAVAAAAAGAAIARASLSRTLQRFCLSP